MNEHDYEEDVYEKKREEKEKQQEEQKGNEDGDDDDDQEKHILVVIEVYVQFLPLRLSGMQPQLCDLKDGDFEESDKENND